jgi:murein DD-endopeptidase MepM/ murein hydrolase activator NlpD
MPVVARTDRSRRWLAGALVAVTAPVVALGGSTLPAFAVTDQQHLSQLQKDASSAADDIGVRDAAAQQAALALTQIQAKVVIAQNALAGANQRLHSAETELDTRRTLLATAQSGERAAEIQVTAATARYGAARDQLGVMLRAAYEQGVGSDLDALMEGGSPDDLADRVGLLDQLSATRQHRLAELASTRDELTRKQDILAAARHRAQQAVAAADAQVDAVAAAESRAKDAATQLVSLQRGQAAAVTTAKQAAAGARERYSQLQAASLRFQELLAARASAGRSVSAMPLSQGSTGALSAGGLVMPTTGVFSSGFGYRIDPFGGGTSFHAGQDIAAPTGTPIVAATAGTVAIVETPGESGGYGNYTCIDRGAGFATCYAHQSVVYVHIGQVVGQRQLIGLVGSTGASTGPHLHFEVRLNGVPVNPVPYLP